MEIPTIEEVLNDFAASYWLKDALRAAKTRDCLDAANDAEMLALILQNELPRGLVGTDKDRRILCLERALGYVRNYTFGLQAKMLEGHKVSMQQIEAIERKAAEVLGDG